VQVSIGWGTNLTNDFVDCVPRGAGVDLTRPSLVCKVTSVEGRPAVKLSDNPAKFSGPEAEIKRYERVFAYAPGVWHEA
jgi:nicotinate phosphoribosyltransferase